MSQKNLLIVVLSLLLLGGGLALWNAQREVPDSTAIEDPTSTDPTVVGENVSFTVTEGEVKKWKLVARQAIYNDKRTEADLTGITGEFYSADGEPIMHFTAPKGHYVNEDNAVVLTGGVTVQSADEKGGQMKAPKMTWSAKSKDVLAEGGVEMIYPDIGKSTARRARFTLDFSTVSLEGGVTSEITQ